MNEENDIYIQRLLAKMIHALTIGALAAYGVVKFLAWYSVSAVLLPSAPIILLYVGVLLLVAMATFAVCKTDPLSDQDHRSRLLNTIALTGIATSVFAALLHLALSSTLLSVFGGVVLFVAIAYLLRRPLRQLLRKVIASHRLPRRDDLRRLNYRFVFTQVAALTKSSIFAYAIYFALTALFIASPANAILIAASVAIISYLYQRKELARKAELLPLSDGNRQQGIIMRGLYYLALLAHFVVHMTQTYIYGPDSGITKFLVGIPAAITSLLISQQPTMQQSNESQDRISRSAYAAGVFCAAVVMCLKAALPLATITSMLCAVLPIAAWPVALTVGALIAVGAVYIQDRKLASQLSVKFSQAEKFSYKAITRTLKVIRGQDFQEQNPGNLPLENSRNFPFFSGNNMKQVKVSFSAVPILLLRK